jgi:hypothetical protein
MTDAPYPLDEDRLILGDLLNHVLDKGVLITGDVTVSIADIDLLRVGLSVMLTSVESEMRRGAVRLIASNADVPLLPDEHGR